MTRKRLFTLALLGLAVLLPAEPALAYIGPGTGLSALGTLVAVLGAAGLLVVGFVWYPVKRLLKGRARPVAPEGTTADD